VLLALLGATAGQGVVWYTGQFYALFFIILYLKLDFIYTYMLIGTSLIIGTPFFIVFGALSDKIGRKANMILYSGIGMLMTVPLMSFLGTNKDPYLAFAMITLALAVISFYTGISGIVKAELFPADIRALGVGLSYALANATFGGTAEFVALWFKDVGMETTFFWYVTVMLAIAFAASLIMPNPKVHGYLDGAGTVEEALGKK
jgi:MHS family alpha-ketoglutarate permease-like MFS transporter